MGFTELLTVVFITLKLLNVISWSWWLVLLPEIIAFALYMMVFVLSLLDVAQTRKMRSKWR